MLLTAQIFFNLKIQPLGSPQTGSIQGPLTFSTDSTGVFTLTLNIDRLAVSTIDGVTYSVPGAPLVLWSSTGPSTTMTDIPARLTRGALKFNPPSASVFIGTPDPYIYKLNVKATLSNKKVEKIEKLVIL